MINYTRNQLENLARYLDGEEYTGNRDKRDDELTAMSILYDCDFDTQRLLDIYVNHNFDLMDFEERSFEKISAKEVRSYIVYYLIQSLNIKREDLALYINSKVFIVRNVVLWRIGKGYAC